MTKLRVLGTEIALYTRHKKDFISLTDIARYKNPDEPKDVVKNWLRNKSTIEFLGLWEKINNPGFKGVEFDSLMYSAGSHHFVLSPTKWIRTTNAIGIISRSGNTGGTFAYKDIALEFASWISAEFKLYIIKEFQRLKEEESEINGLEWNLRRSLTKINYDIHTAAIKENLIPKKITKSQEKNIYADEADVLNVSLFGITAKEWKKKGTLRNHANISQLVCLANLENLNSVLIKDGVPQRIRLIKLNEIAIYQMKILVNDRRVRYLEKN